MKILIAPDSFKGALSSRQVADAIGAGIKRVNPSVEIIKIPLADGGEGTVDSLVAATDGTIIKVKVKDPLLRDITACYGILGDNTTAVIEMAAASGLTLLTPNEQNSLLTSTYGTGQLITDALDRGCRTIIMGLGGSATNDGGLGMLNALGVKFYNQSGQDSSIGGQGLIDLAAIDLSGLDKRIAITDFKAACDVKNPLTGPEGATYIYGPQKGADEATLALLDKHMAKYGKMVETLLGINITDLPGAGAAGGLGAAVFAFLGAELQSGIDLVMQTVQLEKQLSGVDLVFTGEGKIDLQTSFGKALWGVARLAGSYSIPVIALTGRIGSGTEVLYENGFTAIFAIADGPMTLEHSIAQAPFLLESAAERIFHLVKTLYKKC